MCIYSAALLTTGNDAIPVGTTLVAMTAFFITLGAVINAAVFGNIAMLVSQLNKNYKAF